MYRYSMIAKSEESPTERQLAELAAEAVAIKLQIDDVPELHFIEENSAGSVKYPFSINGYCSHTGEYFCVRRGLTPKILVETTVHEMRHVYQCQSGKRHKQSVEMREQDARLFVYEFFGTHSNSGDATALTLQLNEIIKNDCDKLWKRACASVRARSAERAQLSKPADTESDRLRRQFEPVLRARSLEVQRFVDPNNSRHLFPADIEFSAPCASLKVSYQK